MMKVSITKTYFSLTKPGMVLGNLLPAVAGFFLASQTHFNFPLFLATMVGLSLVMASACVFNNYIDSDIDQLMDRTKTRALVKKLIPKTSALVFGIILGIIGFLILIFFTNLTATLSVLVGFLVYVGLYSPLKRKTVHGTLIGSISGATPPVVGYTAVTNQIDLATVILFLILVFWQMPHFYSISIYRIDDYKKAKIPVLPIKKGVFFTKISMLIYLIAFIISLGLLSIFGFTGISYLVVITLVSLIWLVYCLKGFWTQTTKLWARKMFFLSLLIITIFCLIIPVDLVLKSII